MERVAWLDLVGVVLTVGSYAALFFLFGPGPALASMVFLALFSSGPLLNLAVGRPPSAAFDERDEAILMRSSLVGYTIFWVAFVAATMILWACNGARGFVSVEVLPLFPFGGWLVLTGGRSVATLVQYARSR